MASAPPRADDRAPHDDPPLRPAPLDAVPLDAVPLEPLPLDTGTLHRHAARVRVPTYDRSALTPSVVHLGVGGFHRAHQLVYFDELAERGISRDWGVVGVGLHSPAMRDALAPQDYLYTVVERDGQCARARVVGALVDYVFAPDEPARALSVLADPRTRLVTLTVTGTAYGVDRVTGVYEPDAEARADLLDPTRPRSAVGHLVEALDRRRRAGLPAFTVLSCDNVPANGEVARAAVVGFARLRDEALADWIAASAGFPDSMVDRITPATGPQDRDDLARVFGVDDRWPVVTEPFSQWVVEDAFTAGRPPLEHVGVRFVDDVREHATVKARLLNGSHSALGHLGRVAGHGRIDEVMADDVLRLFAARLMSEEIAPQLPQPAGMDLVAHQRRLLRRFANPATGDQLSRLCRRSSTKVPDYLLPSVRQALREGRPYDLLALAVAGWVRYLQGVDDAGRPIEVEDPLAERLTALARRGGTDPRPLLAERSLVGDLADSEELAVAVGAELRSLARDGVRATVAARLGGRRDRPARRRQLRTVRLDTVPDLFPAPVRDPLRAEEGASLPPVPLHHLDSVDRLRDVRAVLLDADGNLFPSEEPAFAASVGVTNRFLRAHGVERELTAEELRRTTTGLNFRTTARALLGGPDVEVPDLEDWVQEERRVVTAHLRSTLRPDPEVLAALTALAAVLPLAAVSSSALSRLAGCFTATGLDELVPPASRFSAEDSLPVPTSKPDPAVYLHACAALGIAPEEGLAVEDSVPGALSAVRAGCPTIGNTTFVPAGERAARAGELRAAGVLTVVSSWAELAGLLEPVLGTADRTAARR